MSLFCNKNLSEAYAKTRLEPSPTVVKMIMSYFGENLVGKYSKALDVGCGTGSSTRILSPYFENVTGIDVSETQLFEARHYPGSPTNVRYLQAEAETAPFPEDSFQLITAGTSIHWFDQKKFIQAARSMLQKDGVLAVYFFEHPIIKGKTQEQTNYIETIIRENQRETFLKYWVPTITGFNYYVGLDAELATFGFRDTQRHEVQAEVKDVTLNQVIAYQTTMPEYYKLIQEEGDEAGKQFMNKLKREILVELGLNQDVGGETTFTVIAKTILVMGRK